MKKITVVDVETTGLFPNRHDRVVEIATVVIDIDGNVVDEFDSLVNPDRDVGSTRIHGISASDLVNAPSFRDVAGTLVERLDGSLALAGHNIRFDYSFLLAEFARVGVKLPKCKTVCTMHLSGGSKLSQACADFGVTFEGSQHSALADARATARLLALQLKDSTNICDDICKGMALQMPRYAFSGRPAVRRSAGPIQPVPPVGYLQRLISRIDDRHGGNSDDAAVLAYYSLLDEVLRDRVISADEEAALLELALDWGLSRQQLLSIHNEYMFNLCAVAWIDGEVTAVERRDLSAVSSMLGIVPAVLSELLERTNPNRRKTNQVEVKVPTFDPTQLAGQRVCFTGESACCFEGKPLSRSKAAALAQSLGLEVVETVSRKLNVLVAADAYSLSGKAKKAKQYSIPIIQERSFWKAVGVPVE